MASGVNLPSLERAHRWLTDDQYGHGEWGRCEARDPTADPRDLELSRIKPNVFTSSQAALALKATGYADEVGALEGFFSWLRSLQAEDGFWTSASGSLNPAGPDRGWSEVHNFRHTAKSLDLLMLGDRFRPEDALTFGSVIRAQLGEGSLPQHPDGGADLWSTAYAMNLMARGSRPSNLPKTLPRNTDEEEWAVHLRGRRDRARGWLLSKRGDDGLWHWGSGNANWTTDAVISQVGADLALHRQDACAAIARRLLEDSEGYRPVRLWGLLLMLPALRPSQQREVLGALEDVPGKAVPESTLDVACHCKLLRIWDDPHQLAFYVRESSGHESALSFWGSWARGDYERWCVARATKALEEGRTAFHETPASKAEAWLTVRSLLDEFRDSVERRRGWEALWRDGSSHANENSAQVLFWNMAEPLARDRGVLVREPETGSGPVDFEFGNGFASRVHMEFKLASHPRLSHGLGQQLIGYMDSEGVDSGFLVVIGFDEADRGKYERLEEEAARLRDADPRKFVDVVFVDARRRRSASVADG